MIALFLALQSTQSGPSDEVCNALNAQSALDLQSVAKYTKVPLHVIPNTGVYDDAAAMAKSWITRCLKASFALPTGENVFGTNIYGREVLRFRQAASDASESWAYYDFASTAGLLLITNGTPVALVNQSTARNHILSTMRRVMKFPNTTYPDSYWGLDVVTLPSGRKLWYGHMRRDIQMDGNNVIGPSTWWNKFVVWSDGLQTYWQWPLRDPSVPSQDFLDVELTDLPVVHRLKAG